ncbi:MAG: DNA topoisomerase IB [Aromatoleum sp.]|jgi:DNA topoisomerase-1|uniref:DNA topoisomerase IB n=1 Tax=Aromatoleum sp. TaxID=2307007 RepID=UPI00289502BF|nr:DNA topoisomerase IB [Aromatoleum sp.]MDT3671141.1 DNA topoisomerase IB [Aromatoleum sp.]
MSNRTEELQAYYLRRIPLDGGGFRYVWPDGKPYDEHIGLARIASLAVPPAWTDVFVSPDADEELQAFGRDARGRLQYRYHPDFVQSNAVRKWRRLAKFAESLPAMRDTTAADLRLAGLPRRKVLALLTRLLDRVHFRVGSTSYVRQYRSYGLTTLCKRHVKLEGTRVVFSYRGKHGVAQQKVLRDRAVVANVERLLALRGAALFQYEDDEGVAHPIRAIDLNAYIRDSIGPFTAKDFRTWGGTLKAAEYLAGVGPVEGERAAARVLVQCVKAVAAELGNTAAVTRGSYICPVIFDRYLEGRVLDDFAPRDENDNDGDGDGLSPSEQALCRMLRSRGRRPRTAVPGARGGDGPISSDSTTAARKPRIRRNFAVRAADAAGHATWR